jgi:hypothetical protein
MDSQSIAASAPPLETVSAAPVLGLERLRFDRAELAGAVADLGVLVPIAVALIVKNGLSPTAVLLPAGILYVVAGLLYRLPVPVQPLKAFGAIAIAQGFGSSEIAAGALLMGGIFTVLGISVCSTASPEYFPSRSFAACSCRSDCCSANSLGT